MSHCIRGGKEMAEAVRELYAQGQTDYSLEPIVLTDPRDGPVGRITGADSVIFCCRRGEREVELTEAFTQVDFPHFERPGFGLPHFVILTLYHEKFKDLPVAFAPSMLKNTLAERVSQAGLRQLHVAESEKYAHVTFFFNGDNNHPFPGEDDTSIPSPRGIPFDCIPALNIDAVVDRVCDGFTAGYELIVANFANGDVIGHTSNNNAKIMCAGHIDAALRRVLAAADRNDYLAFITADHGNLELSVTPEGTPHVSHTANPVPFVIVDPRAASDHLVNDGILADVAPTVLSAFGLKPPSEMSGASLLPRPSWQGKRKVLLLILDGWGIGKEDETNPIHIASTPVWDDLLRKYPNSQLDASGEAVGLVAGKVGNSEAGHMNLGAGRIILQDDVRLARAMQDGSFDQNEIFCATLERVKRSGSSLHLLSLLSEKSSHGSIEYPLALLKMAKRAGLEKVFVHVIFDGRSTTPGSAPDLLARLDTQMNEIGLGQIVSGIGRGIALDRDGDYSKIKRAYDLLVLGTGKSAMLAPQSSQS